MNLVLSNLLTLTCDNVKYYVCLYYNINVFSLIKLNVYTWKVKSIEFDSVHVYNTNESISDICETNAYIPHEVIIGGKYCIEFG